MSPHVAAGVDWGLYSLVGEAGDVPGLRGYDDLFTIPLGVEAAAGYGRGALGHSF